VSLEGVKEYTWDEDMTFRCELGLKLYKAFFEMGLKSLNH
jgi:hypothetical protein